MGISQHGGAQAGVPLHGSKPAAGEFDKTNKKAGNTSDTELKVSYGEIVEVDEDTSRVRVDIYERRGTKTRLGKKKGREEGIFIPIMQPLQIVHLLYGQLRKKLTVRVFWRGKNAPASEAVADIISDLTITEFLNGVQEPRSNELNTGIHDIFTGGVYS